MCSVIMDMDGYRMTINKVSTMLTKKLTNIFILVSLLMTSLVVHAVEVNDAWIREAPPAASMMGGFMVIENPSAKELVLVGASSKTFKHIMLHRTVEEDGVSKMIHQMKILIPAHGKLVFKPGSYHIMMPVPDKRLVAGDKVMIRLEFKSGESKDVEFVVRKGMGMNHGGGGHHHH